jgi:uncharacterized protein YbjT (DUF2867 family)
MQIQGARAMVVGATGVLGSTLARALHERGARLVIAGRDRARLSALSSALNDCARVRFAVGDGFAPDAVIGGWAWAFHLAEPSTGATRLLVRTGWGGPGAGPARRLALRALGATEVIMQQRMLRGVKLRAETTRE